MASGIGRAPLRITPSTGDAVMAWLLTLGDDGARGR